MTEHLSPDTFERLSQHKLKGAELLGALDHLEECEECCLKVKSPTRKELIDTLFGDDNSQDKTE